MASHDSPKLLSTILIAAVAVGFVGSNARPAYSASLHSAPIFGYAPHLSALSSMFSSNMAIAMTPSPRRAEVEASTRNALDALASSVRRLSDESALPDAFESYFAFKAAHPEQVQKPYLYFVDYGLPSSKPRGYVFNMDALSIVDGPFMVAHGRGSAASATGIPTRFSNKFGTEKTSLGLYVAQELYRFTGHAGGRLYHSIGLRLAGVSGDFNDNARARGVVAHGAPYVTATRAGRSEGCPAMAMTRARRLLPKLANGGLVFLFAPDSNWMTHDPWLTEG
jgi:hypothetical protein